MKQLVVYLKHGFGKDERGAALTEFIITLPVVVIIFAGLVALGRLGDETGKVKIRAQLKMWEKATGDNPGFITPRAAVTSGGEFSSVVDGLVTAGGGHWGESYTRVKIPEEAPLLNPQLTPSNAPVSDPEDVIGDSGYAEVLVNDTLSTSPPSGGVAQWISWGVRQSGAVPYLGAGVRYGYVEGKVENHEVTGFAGQSITMSARYRTLAPPDPTSENMSWGISRLLAEGQTNYPDLLVWGSSDLETESLNIPDL